MNERMNNPPTKARVALCWIALIATIACNALFESLRLGGTTSAEVSNQVFTWFMPAGYVFSIWGVIYAALLIWMAIETKRSANGIFLSWRNTVLFVISCVLNVTWLVTFHFQQILASLVILALLWVVLAMLYMGLRDDEGRSRLNLAPFSLYFAWSTVAVIVNATNFATRVVATPLIVHQISTVVLAIAVLVIAYLSTRNSRDFVFPLVVIWALVGVGVNLSQVDPLVSSIVFAVTAMGALAMYVPAIATRLGLVKM